jgi:hypothetical protein
MTRMSLPICCGERMIFRVQSALSNWRGRVTRGTSLPLVTTVAGASSLVLWLLFVATSLHLCAQTASTGALTGTVTDPTGAVMPNAKITLRNYGTDGTLTAFTRQNGSYRFSLLPAGEYELTIEAVNFATAVVSHVLIQITEVTSITTQLTVKGASEEVVVKVPLLQTDNATLGSVIDRQAIVTLPLVNRNYTQILGLTAGTNTNVVDATQLGAGSQEIRANGARSGDNNFMVNGVDSNSDGANMTEATPNGGGGLAIPAPDAIQEFKVQTSLYDAQYGRGSGANVVIETRSGTAEFHGNVYYFGRNEALDANNFFANATGVPRGDFRRNQPGGTFGGPMPWSRKRTLFFVSYQATRDVNAASLASSVRSLSLPPIPQIRTPVSLGAIFGGQTGLFGGVAVAQDGSNINPVALNLLNTKNPDGSFVIPAPQIVSSGVNYTAVLPGRYDEDQFNTNVDHIFSKADQLSAKFFWSNSDQNLPFSGATIPGFPALRRFANRNLAISHTHTFSASAVNQFRAGFTHVGSRSSSLGTLTAQDVGISRVGDAQVRSLPNMLVLGAFRLGHANEDKSRTSNNHFYFSDILSLARGKHNLRLGSEIFRNQFNESPDYTDGSLTLLSFPDFLLGLPSGPVSAGGNGTPISNVFSSLSSATVVHAGLRSTAAHLFVVEDWKISSTLTVNLGFRLEANGQQSEAHGRMANFATELYVPPLPGGFTDPTTSGFVLPDNYTGSAPEGFPRGNSTLLNDSIKLHPEPRIGVAWLPFPSRNIVVRSGYGVYANRLNFFGGATNLAFLPPFQFSKLLIGAANAEANLQQPFPALPPASSFPNFIGTMLPGPPYTGDRTPLLVGFIDPDFREASSQHYGLQIQYQLKSYLLSLAYAGATGTHLTVIRSNNQPALASLSNPVNGLTANSVTNAVERVRFLGIAPPVFALRGDATSHYDSLLATIDKRFSYGFRFLAAYTFSKSIDTAGDSIGSSAFGFYGDPIFGEQTFNDQNNPTAQRGLSDFDRRHRLVVSYTWELPQKANRSKVSISRLSEGWAISGVVALQSGLPFTIYDTAAGTLFGPATFFTTGSLEPGATLDSAVRKGSVSGRVDQFFNTNVFVPAPFVPDGGLIDGQFPVSGGGTIFGNLGRNILRGPDQRNIDIGIVKRTRLSDKASLVFRWEVFNLFNRPNFANPASDVSSPATFGKITAMSVNPRIMQYGLKVEF